MEDLFSANLSVNNQNVLYSVAFHDNQYFFVANNEQSEHQSFSFKREHDEWHDQGSITPELKSQAVDALERYLMKQH